MKALVVVLSIVSLVCGAERVEAHEVAEDPAPDEWQVDDGTVIEVALGGTQLFAPTALGSDLERVVPTQTSMLMVEWFLHYRWHPAIWFNLPTAPRIVFENEVPVERYVPPALAAGLVWIPLTIPFSEKRHRFELHAGLFGGAVLSLDGNFFGIAAVRAYVLHESEFGVYIGAAAAPRLDTAALIYGIGYRF